VEGILKHQTKFHDDYCETKTWGNADYEEFLHIVQKVTGHPKWLPEMPILTDHRELDFSGISKLPRKVSLASIHVTNKNKPGEMRIAVIISPEAAETYADLWQTICRYFEFPVEHKVFFDKKEALHWLLSKKGQETPYV
jgi:hypothetical protein